MRKSLLAIVVLLFSTATIQAQLAEATDKVSGTRITILVAGYDWVEGMIGVGGDVTIEDGWKETNDFLYGRNVVVSLMYNEAVSRNKGFGPGEFGGTWSSSHFVGEMETGMQVLISATAMITDGNQFRSVTCNYLYTCP